MGSWTTMLTGSWTMDSFIYVTVALFVIPIIVVLYEEVFKKKNGLLLSLPPFVGLYMYYKNPNLPVADSAMPLFLKDFLHPAIGGIIMMFILFAMLSTISSVL